MKLGTLKEGGRDGTPIVVSRDLRRAVEATAVAPTLQAALDDWAAMAAPLQSLYDDLNAGRAAGAFDFDPAACASPLPRAYQFVDGSSYLNHVALVRKARGASMPPEFLDEPLMYQGESDAFYGPRDDIPMASESYGIDFESEVSVIVDDTPMGATPEQCNGRIRLAMILNDVSLRGLIPAELAKGFGFLNGKGSTAFSPVAVTLDELGEAWRGGKIHLPLVTHWNGAEFGRPNAGVDMNFNLPRLISPRRQNPPARRRNHRRLRHGFQRRSEGRLFLHRRNPRHRDGRARQAQNALHGVRRHRPGRDVQRRRRLHLRRHRAAGSALHPAGLSARRAAGRRSAKTAPFDMLSRPGRNRGTGPALPRGPACQDQHN